MEEFKQMSEEISEERYLFMIYLWGHVCISMAITCGT